MTPLQTWVAGTLAKALEVAYSRGWAEKDPQCVHEIMLTAQTFKRPRLATKALFNDVLGTDAHPIRRIIQDIGDSGGHIEIMSYGVGIRDPGRVFSMGSIRGVPVWLAPYMARVTYRVHDSVLIPVVGTVPKKTPGHVARLWRACGLVQYAEMLEGVEIKLNVPFRDEEGSW